LIDNNKVSSLPLFKVVLETFIWGPGGKSIVWCLVVMFAFADYKMYCVMDWFVCVFVER